jgi:hypothetical protein
MASTGCLLADGGAAVAGSAGIGGVSGTISAAGLGAGRREA